LAHSVSYKTMKSLLFLSVIFSVQVLVAQSEDARKKNFNVKKNVAIDGYDPVSYFDGKPTEGESKWSYVYKGVGYQFSTAANLTKFKTNPDKYEPAYGGWCAYAMGESGEKVKIDPETFKIIEGKLYLFYNYWGNNTLTTWSKNEKTLKTKADQSWKKFLPGSN
jgi:YHS domain-containing protein